MERFLKSRVFITLVYIVLILLVLLLLLLIKPMILHVYRFLEAVLTPFLVAMIISYLLNPVVRLLIQRKVPRTMAVLLIYTVFIAVVTVFIMNFIPIFLKQLKELNEHLPELSVKAQSLVDGINQNKSLPHGVRTGFYNLLLKLEGMVSAAITNFINDIGRTINMLFIAFIIPFLAFYMLKDYQIIEKSALAMVPRTFRKQTMKLLWEIDQTLGSYVRGQLLVCLIIGIMAYTGYWIIGIPYPLLLASLVTLFDVIPYLGPFIGAAPALLMASMISWKMVLLAALVNLLVQVLESNVASPLVVGKSLRMHPLTIILALLVGGEMAGVVGLILAVPFFAVLKVLIQHVFIYHVHRKTP